MEPSLTPTYRVLGSDQREYGPVTAEQIRLWILDRRLHAHSLVRREGTADWQPLSLWPEFSLLVAPPPTALAPGGMAASQTVGRTNGMAVASLMMGICSTLFACCCYGFPFNVLGITFGVLALNQIKQDPSFQQSRPLAVAGLVLSSLGLILPVVLASLGVIFNLDDTLREFRRSWRLT